MILRTISGPLERPTWRQIEEAVHALDGCDVSSVIVDRGGEYMGLAGGADDLCMIVWERPEESSETALNRGYSGSADAELGMVVAGQYTEVPRRRLIEKRIALDVLQEFLEVGTRSTLVDWYREY